MKKHIWNSTLSEVAKSPLYEKLGTVKAKAIEAMSDVKYKVQRHADDLGDVAQRLRRGWTYMECWNYGDYSLARAADICAYLYNATYSNPDNLPSEDYMENLLRCEKVFRAYAATDDTVLDMAHAKVTNYMEQLEKIDKMRDKTFMPAWMWYGQNVLNPSKYIVPDKPDGSARNGARAFASKAKGYITYEDVENLPVTECRRIADVLTHLAYHANSYSEQYYGTEDTLPGKNDEWENGRPLMMGFRFSRGEAWGNEVWERDSHGFWQQKSRKEIGLDWCAWIEDLHEVASVLRMYADWNSPVVPTNTQTGKPERVPAHNHYSTLRESVQVLDPDEAASINATVEERFETIWRWLGRTGARAWD